jgi:non-ribosomal peptide synthase protein (TIGR01720 family)
MPEQLGAQIGFNYLGQWDTRPAAGPGQATPHQALPMTALGSFGQDHDPADRKMHLVEVAGSVQRGQLRFTWSYCPDVHDLSTIEAVAEDFARALASIARDCRNSETAQRRSK